MGEEVGEEVKEEDEMVAEQERGEVEGGEVGVGVREDIEDEEAGEE